MISTLIMGSPARRLTNPITRCWAHPHHRYAGTDDGRGTDHMLDAERLTLMSGRGERAGRLDVDQHGRTATRTMGRWDSLIAVPAAELADGSAALSATRGSGGT